MRSTFFEKLIWLYLGIGLLIVAALAIILGFTVTFIISIVIIVLFLIGFIVIMVKAKKVQSEMLLRTHFNLSLALRTENERLFSKFGLRARTGFLSRWIEFRRIDDAASPSKKPFLKEQVKL